MTPKTPGTNLPREIPKMVTPFTAMCGTLSPLIYEDNTSTPLHPSSPLIVSPLRDNDVKGPTIQHIQEWVCPSTPPVLPATPSKSPPRRIVGILLPFFDSCIKKKAAEPLTIGVRMKYGSTVNKNGVRISRRNVKKM